MIALMTQAAYALIREEVRTQILSGALPPGAQVPTEAELQTTYRVSRVTAQQALRDLAREGLIIRHRGRGSYVAEWQCEQNLLRMINFLGSGPELPGGHQVLSARVVPAGDLDLGRVEVDPSEPVFDLERSKGEAGNLVALERTHVPFRLAPHLLDEPLETLTTYDYLRRHGAALARARMYVRPHRLTEREAGVLDAEAGSACFAWERITYLEDHRWAEVARYTVLATAIDFFVEYQL
jgi:GntR family transcriptional regulator